MFKKTIFIIFSLSIFSCAKKTEKDFVNFSTHFSRDFGTLFPDETPLSKENERLFVLPVPDSFYFDSLRQFYIFYSAELKGFNVNNPEFPHVKEFKKDVFILKNVEKYLQDHTYNPLHYNVLYGFKRILETDFASDIERTQIIFDKLDYVPVYYDAVKIQLLKANRKSVDIALKQQLETYIFFDKTLTSFLTTYNLMTPQYMERIDAAKLAIKDYMAFLNGFR